MNHAGTPPFHMHSPVLWCRKMMRASAGMVFFAARARLRHDTETRHTRTNTKVTADLFHDLIFISPLSFRTRL